MDIVDIGSLAVGAIAGGIISAKYAPQRETTDQAIAIASGAAAGAVVVKTLVDVAIDNFPLG